MSKIIKQAFNLNDEIQNSYLKIRAVAMQSKPEKYLNRIVAQKQVFQVDGTFQSMYAAERWLSENGYSAGSTCAPMPTAVMKGDYYSYDLPHKWKNFTAKEKNSVHGVMVGDLRDGPVTVYIFQTNKK